MRFKVGDLFTSDYNTPLLFKVTKVTADGYQYASRWKNEPTAEFSNHQWCNRTFIASHLHLVVKPKRYPKRK